MAQTQRHPSRDERPAEWENTSRNGIRLHPGGYYGHEELETAKSFWHSEGNPAEGHHVTMPSQGRLFDPEAHHAKVRQDLGEQRMPGFSAYGDIAEATQAVNVRKSALESSVIPTSHLQSRVSAHGGEQPESRFVIERGLADRGTLGHYTGPPLSQFQTDYVTVDPEGPSQDRTTIHELGHRQHLGTREAGSPLVQHPRGTFPDPLMEAHADAYVDRYGGSGSSQVSRMSRDIEEGLGKFGSYQYTGYSTNFESRDPRSSWTPQDRALYAGVRAHYSETGENTNYQPSERARGEMPGHGEPTIDATLHSLLSNSPHAAQAMRQTGLKQAGQEGFRRHRDRQLMNQGQMVQGSLFNELRGFNTGKVHGYTPNLDAQELPEADDAFEAHFEGLHRDIDKVEAKAGEAIWPTHMNHNQFGEKPRSQYNVHQTLGISPAGSKHRGFTDR
jgi:hypothetical protein